MGHLKSEMSNKNFLMICNFGPLYNGLDCYTKKKTIFRERNSQRFTILLWNLLENYEENIKMIYKK